MWQVKMCSSWRLFFLILFIVETDASQRHSWIFKSSGKAIEEFYIDAARAHSSKLAELSMKNINLAEKFDNGDTILCRCLVDTSLEGAESKRIEMVKWLISKGANVNEPGIDGQTPLSLAVSSNKVSLAEVLIKNGALPDVENVKGETLLCLAVVLGYSEMVSVLTKGGANPNGTCRGGEPLLHLAARIANGIMVAKLLDNGANPNVRCKEWNTPLHVAIAHENLGAVEELIKVGNIRLNCINKSGLAPLHMAMSCRCMEVAKVLIGANGPNLNIPDRSSRRPLHMITSIGNFEIAAMLIKSKQIDPSMRDNDGNTPLHLAISGAFNEIAKLLIEKHGMVLKNIRNNSGNTPLNLAIHCGNEEMAARLVMLDGVCLNTRNNMLETPLCAAIKLGYRNTVVALLLAGADPNTMDSDRKMPLALAILNRPSLEIGNMEEDDVVVARLLMRGANLSAIDRPMLGVLHQVILLCETENITRAACIAGQLLKNGVDGDSAMIRFVETGDLKSIGWFLYVLAKCANIERVKMEMFYIWPGHVESLLNRLTIGSDTMEMLTMKIGKITDDTERQKLLLWLGDYRRELDLYAKVQSCSSSDIFSDPNIDINTSTDDRRGDKPEKMAMDGDSRKTEQEDVGKVTSDAEPCTVDEDAPDDGHFVEDTVNRGILRNSKSGALNGPMKSRNSVRFSDECDTLNVVIGQDVQLSDGLDEPDGIIPERICPIFRSSSSVFENENMSSAVEKWENIRKRLIDTIT